MEGRDYNEIYEKELARLRQYWQGIPEERLQFWAKQVANVRCKVNG